MSKKTILKVVLFVLACGSVETVQPLSGKIINELFSVSFVAAPLALPGIHFYSKRQSDRKSGVVYRHWSNQNWCKQNGYGDYDVFKEYCTGVCYGATPGLNVVTLYLNFLGYALKHYQVQLTKEQRASCSGFFSGVSLYATLPLAIAFLKKI